MHTIELANVAFRNRGNYDALCAERDASKRNKSTITEADAFRFKTEQAKLIARARLAQLEAN